jgi:hypothetical protein
MKRLSDIIFLNTIFCFLACSCESNKKSEELAAKADGRILYLLLAEYRGTNNGNLPRKLDDLDLSAIKGSIIKGSDSRLSDWVYFIRKPDDLESNPMIFKKNLSNGHSVIVRIKGEVRME